MALMCLAEAVAHFRDGVREQVHACPELMRMGADIRVDGGVAMVKGPKKLTPAPVAATDLRASVSLVLAALATEGTSEVSRILILTAAIRTLKPSLAPVGPA